MKPVGKFSVEVVFAFQERLLEKATFDPKSWRAAAERLCPIRDRELGKRVCVVTKADADPESPPEHVIPQGSGIRWIELPSGLVAGEFNNRASAWELDFFRKGLMGMLRPFYVFGKKRIEFSNSDGKRIVFINDPKAGFTIETHGLAPLPDRMADGPGGLRLQLPLNCPPTRAVSCTLTKLAYLVLLVMRPEIALSEVLDEARTYLTDDDAPYRPYGERFVPRRSASASVRFLIPGSHIQGDTCGVAAIHAVIQIHHVDYQIQLAGEPQAPSGDMKWFDEELPSGRRQVGLGWQFDGATRED